MIKQTKEVAAGLGGPINNLTKDTTEAFRHAIQGAGIVCKENIIAQH